VYDAADRASIERTATRLAWSAGIDGPGATAHAPGVKERSHQGQRHKGCGLCDPDKRRGNAAERRPARDRREIERTRQEVAAT
jgi:hypothetical protein